MSKFCHNGERQRRRHQGYNNTSSFSSKTAKLKSEHIHQKPLKLEMNQARQNHKVWQKGYDHDPNSIS